MKILKLSEIVTTAGTQIRARVDADAVDEYAEAMASGAKFPPVIVFHDGSQYVLADGFHRVMAAARNGLKDITAEIHKGTKADALKYALGANSAHGIKRTNADKRRSVELALAEWPKLSDREIAKICAVSDKTVADVRRELTAEIPQLNVPAHRIGRDGKERKLPAKRQQSEMGDEPEPEDTFDEPAIQTADEEFKSACGLPKDSPALLRLKIDWEEADTADRTEFRHWINKKN